MQSSGLILKILEDTAATEEEKDERIHALLEQKVSSNTDRAHHEQLRLKDRSADAIAKFVGSWSFIFVFLLLLAAWIVLNAYVLLKAPDPYPFILLNLILSTLATIQAPLIMMSQNRQEEKDRLRSENDYLTNLKSEIILQDLSNKVQLILDNQTELLNKQTEKERDHEQLF